ncbi:SLC13 family permease [Candidatus Poribacteria bacterium]|nr:SLC13 family permease [Candidatus Poribacteria bacterium]
MGLEALLTLAVLAGVFLLLILTNVGPDLCLMGGVAVLLAAGVLDVKQALAGFSNEGVITVGVLFVVAAGVRDTGAFWFLVHHLLGFPKTQRAAITRITLPVAALSGFMNNTPLVAMTLPVVMDWARKNRLPVSKLLIPLSYAAILGGMCTLIGTSTTLNVNGMVIDAGMKPMGMFTITPVGLPIAVVGSLFLIVAGARLLPSRATIEALQEDPRQYVLEMTLEPSSPLVGQTIEAAGLRHLPGLYLMEISRADGEAIVGVGPHIRLHSGDQLVFVGIVESVVDLQKIPGLKPATDQVYKLDHPPANRALFEAVVSHTSPMVGQSIREGKFRTRYNAVVIAACRNGERVQSKIGDIVVQAGDTLLLDARPTFAENHRNSQDFYLVSRIEGYTPPRHDRAWVSLAILGAMVVAVGAGLCSMLLGGLVAGGLMILTRCCTGDSARASIDWRLLVAIAGALGLGQALLVSGAAAALAGRAISLAGDHPWAVLACVYLTTVVITEMVTNNAAAVLMFPVAMAAAKGLDVSTMPFVMAVAIGASAGFISPIGYQTHMMVYGPGGYKFRDFIRIGTPLSILVGTCAVTLIPLLWPF